MVTKDYPIDEIMDAFGHQTRRDILALLKDAAMPVGDIAERLPVSRPAVSKHLRILEQAGLVEYTSSGTRNIFRLRSNGFNLARAYLADFWDEALSNFQRVVEDTTEVQAVSAFDAADAIKKTIVVRCSVDTAFRIWTEQVHVWWPKGHSRSGNPDTRVLIESQVGGRLYERTPDGREYDWGTIIAWEPPHHFAYHWYLGSSVEMPTRVDVHFASHAPGGT